MVRQASGMSCPSRGYIDAILDWLDGKLWIYDQLGTAKTGEMLEDFRYAARRYGVNHFIVDSLAKLGMAEDDEALKIIDRIVPEPVGGAHRAPEAAIAALGDAIEQELNGLSGLPRDTLLAAREDKFLAMGRA